MQPTPVDIEARFSYNTCGVKGFIPERLEEMSVQELSVDEICDTIRALPEDQLDQVLRFLQDLKQMKDSVDTPVDDPVAPLYGAHTAAVRTGVPDLAHRHDHHLYGLDKRDG